MSLSDFFFFFKKKRKKKMNADNNLEKLFDQIDAIRQAKKF